MRIAFWVNVFPPRYETFVLNQMEGMVRRGCDVDIISRKRGGQQHLLAGAELNSLLSRARYRDEIPERAGPRRLKASVIGMRHPSLLRRMVSRLWTRSDGHSTPPAALLFEAKPLLEGRPYDIVHCAYGPIGEVAADLKKLNLLRGAIVTSFRGHDLGNSVIGSDVYRNLAKYGDCFLPVSEEFRRRLCDLGFPESRIHVVRDSMDCSKFPLRIPRWTAGEPLRLVTVGRLIEKKGMCFAIEAVDRLRSRFPTIELRIIGEGDLHEPLQRLIDERQLAGRVVLLGWQPHDRVAAELQAAHIMVQPSVTSATGDQEGIPTVIKEAMSMGLPIVATRHAGIPELVEDGVTGLLVGERDPDAIAGAVETLVSQPERWETMGQAARARVEHEYDKEVVNDRLFEIYREIVSR